MTRFSAQSADRVGRILVVDDDDSRAGFVAALRTAGYEVAEACGAVQSMRLILSYRADAVVLDLVPLPRSRPGGRAPDPCGGKLACSIGCESFEVAPSSDSR